MHSYIYSVLNEVHEIAALGEIYCWVVAAPKRREPRASYLANECIQIIEKPSWVLYVFIMVNNSGWKGIIVEEIILNGSGAQAPWALCIFSCEILYTFNDKSGHRVYSAKTMVLYTCSGFTSIYYNAYLREEFDRISEHPGALGS